MLKGKDNMRKSQIVEDNLSANDDIMARGFCKLMKKAAPV